MNTKRDKVVAEALGIPWHEVDNSLPWNSHPQCSCGEWFYSKDSLLGHIEKLNPDFSTDSGMCLILRLGPERKWWDEFSMYSEYINWSWVEGVKYYSISLRLLQDPDKLANELEKFLEGSKICG